MSKYKAPEPGLNEVLTALEGVAKAGMYARGFVTPDVSYGRAHVGIELIYRHTDQRTSVVRREGELISSKGSASVTGAMYRAALRLFVFLEGIDQHELVKKHLWNNDYLS